jgi:dihydroorotate dehydrogenase
VTCLDAVHGHASYVTVNVSSPNTAGLRALQERDALEGLLRRLTDTRERLADRDGKKVPLALKVSPDLAPGQIVDIAATVRRYRIDALIATNTSLTREGVEGLASANEAGGLSGAPIRSRATTVLAAFAAELKAEVALIGAGGILRGEDAQEKLAAGASLVQLYTGLIYRGPDLVCECVRQIAAAQKAAA